MNFYTIDEIMVKRHGIQKITLGNDHKVYFRLHNIITILVKVFINLYFLQNVLIRFTQGIKA